MIRSQAFMTASVMALVVCGRAVAGEPEASRAADSVGTRRVWQSQPAPEGARLEPLRARAVDFGDDYAWRYPDQYGWSGKSVFHKELDLDEDGEKDDCMHTIEFSLSRPFNPVFPWDPEGTNARFYGGLTGFFMDTQEGRFSEGGGPNIDHGTNDDLNFMSFYFEPGKRVSSKLPLGGYTYNYLSRIYGLRLSRRWAELSGQRPRVARREQRRKDTGRRDEVAQRLRAARHGGQRIRAPARKADKTAADLRRLLQVRPGDQQLTVLSAQQRPGAGDGMGGLSRSRLSRGAPAQRTVTTRAQPDNNSQTVKENRFMRKQKQKLSRRSFVKNSSAGAFGAEAAIRPPNIIFIIHDK